VQVKYKVDTLYPDADGVYETPTGWHMWEILDRFLTHEIHDNVLAFKVVLIEDEEYTPDFGKMSTSVSPGTSEKFDKLQKESGRKPRSKTGDA
jgi:hypothetical protein